MTDEREHRRETDTQRDEPTIGKETVKDLTPDEEAGEGVKGGRPQAGSLLCAPKTP